GSGALRQLEGALRGKRMLLIVDDLERAGVRAVSQVLARCAGVTVLATADRWMGIREEWTLEVTGLAVPGTAAAVEGSAAGAGLLHHARRHGGGEELTAVDREAIGRICRAVDGHPLALILAAHWRPTW